MSEGKKKNLCISGWAYCFAMLTHVLSKWTLFSTMQEMLITDYVPFAAIRTEHQHIPTCFKMIINSLTVKTDNVVN